MKITPRFYAATALVGLIFLAASPQSASAALIPGTPLDGTNEGRAILVLATFALVEGGPYGQVADISDADKGVPGDIVFLTPVTGSTILDEDRSNWAAVARFYSPADPAGSIGTDATQAVGFLATASPLGPATDFSTFDLFPNVYYINAASITPGEGVNSTITVFGPAGAIIPAQTAVMLVGVTGIGVPEPASIALLGLGSTLLLARRRHGRPILIANQMD